MKKLIKYYKSMDLGSGLRQIADDDRMVFYIVPNNILVFPLKEKLNQLDPLLLNKVNVMTFDQVLRELQPKKKNTILSRIEQIEFLQILLGELIIKNELQYFFKVVDQPGSIERILDWILELKAALITPSILARLWNLSERKYLELIKIYKGYQELLIENSVFDKWDSYIVATELLKARAGNLNVDKIILEQFTDLMPVQIQLLSEFANTGISVNVNFLTVENRDVMAQHRNSIVSLLTKAGFCLERLEETGDNIETTEKTKDLDYLTENIFKAYGERMPADESLKLVYTSSTKQEIMEIAARVKEHLKTGQICLEEIAIVAQPISEYQNLIIDNFAESRIPLNASKIGKLNDSAYFNLLENIFKVKAGSKERWVDLIYQQNLNNHNSEFRHRMKELFIELGAPENMSVWHERMNERNASGNKKLTEITIAMKQLYALIDKVPQQGTHRDYISFIVEFIKEYKVAQKISNQALNNLNNETRLFEQICYKEFMKLLDTLKNRERIYNSTKILSINDWIILLKRFSELTEFSGVNQASSGVTLLRPDQIYGRKFKVVFIVGLLEGAFPRNRNEDWLIKDNDYQFLVDAGFFLKSSSEYSSIEKMNFYEVVNAATECLYLLCPAKDEEGAENLISSFLDEVVSLFEPDTISSKKIELADLLPKSWDDIVTKKQALHRTYYELYREQQETGVDQLSTMNLYSLQTNDVNDILQINYGIRSIIDKENNLLSVYDGCIAGNIKLAKEIDERIWSATQLNRASHCRFAFFAENILRLSSWEEPEAMIDPLLRGNLFHSVLEKIMSAYSDPAARKLTNREIDHNINQVEKIILEEFTQLRAFANHFIEPIFIDLGLSQISRDIKNVLSHEKYWRERANEYFYPKYLEYGFGFYKDSSNRKKSIAEVLELNYLETTVRIRGKIDRIDHSENGYYTVYDYKSGGLPDKRAIERATDLQLYIYLLVLTELLQIEQGKIAGAAYYGIGRLNVNNVATSSRNRGLWKMKFKDELGLNINKNSGYEEEKWKELVDAAKERIRELVLQLRSGDFAVVPTESCPSYCNLKQICRVNKERTRWKKYEGRGAI